MITGTVFAQPVSPSPGRVLTSQAAIVGEIAQRLGEMEEDRLLSGIDFINRLSAIAAISPRMFSVTIGLLAGQLDAVVDSFATQSSKRGLTKQALHWEYHNELALLAEHFPELARVIGVIRSSIEHHEDPQSKADLLRNSMEQEDEN